MKRWKRVKRCKKRVKSKKRLKCKTTHHMMVDQSKKRVKRWKMVE